MRISTLVVSLVVEARSEAIPTPDNDYDHERRGGRCASVLVVIPIVAEDRSVAISMADNDHNHAENWTDRAGGLRQRPNTGSSRRWGCPEVTRLRKGPYAARLRPACNSEREL